MLEATPPQFALLSSVIVMAMKEVNRPTSSAKPPATEELTNPLTDEGKFDSTIANDEEALAQVVEELIEK
ncbi:unnamed protein product [Linum trigynum]|uniref:Uncharacterized protein n=1 Tax=Linum trigynum TaxID=586398 RepID=A0AAV2G857_9ROSI